MNYWAILLAAVVSMAIGFVWYGPLFGRTWMRILNVNAADLERRKEMQKSAGPLYFIQFLLALFQIYVLSRYIHGFANITGLENAMWIWAAFIMPTVAGACMWNNDSSKVSWTKFLIQAGYQLVIFVVAALIIVNLP